ncbi:MAG: transporter permease [Solimicrobium sp.]|jgi:peptide/nickel transport system permease protein|nr:transporter permease [Solimicrobium sp.]
MNSNSPNLWLLAWRRLCTDRIGLFSLAIVAAYLLIVIASAIGLIASDWDEEIAINYAAPGFIGAQKALVNLDNFSKEVLPENPIDPLNDIIKQLNAELSVEQPVIEIKKRTTLPFGADKWGRDIIQKTIKGAQTSITVGLIAALLATFLGTIFGALSGYFGGWVDDIFNWIYSIFTSIPYLLLVLSVAAVLQQNGVINIVLILALTGWTGTFRLIRVEYMKHKEREYVLAADAIGASNYRKMFAHIFPNVSHIALVQMSISVVSFIKSEVILSFLGFGVPVGAVSWGSILDEAQNELILGKWWQLVAVTIAMGVLVTAFSLFTDALRDALDPKLKGFNSN